MICGNCGYSNQPSDEFCGSCGQFLEWTGEPATGAGEQSQTATEPGQEGPGVGQQDEGASEEEGGATQQSGASQAGAGGQQGGVGPQGTSDQPTTFSPTPPPITAPNQQRTSFAGQGPDVICWNCGRRNPAGRAFCMQCRERLTTGARPGAAGGGGAAGTATTTEGRNWPKLLAVGAGVLVVLLLVGVGAVVFLGGQNGPLPTPVAVVSQPPSAPAQSAAGTLVTTSAPTDTNAPTATASHEVTPSPSATAILPPTATPTVKPTKKPTPTPEPTNCAHSTEAVTNIVLDFVNTDAMVPLGRRWCIHFVTFIWQSGSFTVHLEHNELPFEYATMDGTVEKERHNYVPPMLWRANNRAHVEVDMCDELVGPCSGQVRIGYEEVDAPGP